MSRYVTVSGIFGDALVLDIICALQLALHLDCAFPDTWWRYLYMQPSRYAKIILPGDSIITVVYGMLYALQSLRERHRPRNEM